MLANDTEKKENEKLQKTSIPSLPKNRDWYFFDLKDKVIGRVATKIAEILRGKNRNDFSPNSDLGSYVVLVNAKSLLFTGQKLDKKYYYNHSGHPGGMRQRSLRIMINDYPTELVHRVIKGMMPHTKLSNQQIKRLFVYPNDIHPHQAQEKNFVKIRLM